MFKKMLITGVVIVLSSQAWGFGPDGPFTSLETKDLLIIAEYLQDKIVSDEFQRLQSIHSVNSSKRRFNVEYKEEHGDCLMKLKVRDDGSVRKISDECVYPY